MAKETAISGSIEIDWIDRDVQIIEGLDHLGIQIVSVNIYGALLPGITNVTERARYFSFYPWVIHRFAKDAPANRTKKIWREWFRRLDFSYATACVAYELANPDISTGAVVGADAARRLLHDRADGDSINLHNPADVDEKGNIPKTGAYFKNPEGGFGQYYKNPLKELRVLIDDPEFRYPDVKLTSYAGKALADALDAQPAFAQLLHIAEKGRSTPKRLCEIGRDIHPASIVPGDSEESFIRKLLLVGDDELSSAQNQEHREWRSQSFLAMLHFLKDNDGVEDQPDTEFRWTCMAGALQNGKPWNSESLRPEIIHAWGTYHRNDLLNYSLEVLLAAALGILKSRSLRPWALADEVAAMALEGSRAGYGGMRIPPAKGPVSRWIETCRRSPKVETEDPWGKGSSRALFDSLRKAAEDKDYEAAAPLAFCMLGRLATDSGSFKKHPFETIPRAVALARAYEVHLANWLGRLEKCNSQDIRSFARELILEWILFRHLRVATRKLANQGVSTFKYRVEEGLLVSLPDQKFKPTLTSPRISQAFRMLSDLHFAKSDGDRLVLTPSGKKIVTT